MDNTELLTDLAPFAGKTIARTEMGNEEFVLRFHFTDGTSFELYSNHRYDDDFFHVENAVLPGPYACDRCGLIGGH